MLAVNTKKTDKVDFLKPLTKYIKKEFSNEAAEEHSAPLNRVHGLREEIRLSFGNEKTEAARVKLLEYYGLACSVERRFPIHEKAIKINFYWYDNVTNKRCSQYSLLYERSCMIFNIGAIESQIACMQNRGSDEGIKAACKYFQLAAGSFAKLLDFVQRAPQLSGTPDLQQAYLSMLIHVMLAQAQECFYEKAARANMNPVTLCKLSSQVLVFYDQAFAAMSQPDVTKAIDNLWPTHILFRIAHFRAMSFYLMSQHHKAACEYGVEIAYLQRAYGALADPNLVKPLKSAHESIARSFQSTQALIGNALNMATKDNNKIYHETVPKQVPAFEPKGMVKALPFEGVPLPFEEDPFRALMPPAVKQALENYNEARDTLVRKENGTMEERDAIAKGSLSSMNLPGAILASQTPKGIPPDLQERVEKFLSTGGLKLLQDLSSTVKQLAGQDSSILEEAGALLDAEEAADEEKRNLHSTRWVRAPSYTAAMTLRQELVKYRGNLDHARKSDAFVQRNLSAVEPLLRTLSSGRAELEAMLPPVEQASGETMRFVKDLHLLLQRLDQIVSEREGLRKELAELAAKDDVSSALMTTQLSHESVVQEELNKYADIQLKIKTNVDQQTELLEAISNANAQFVSSKGGAQQTPRDLAFQRIEEGFKTFYELQKNLSEGIQFYTNFQELLNRFKSKCTSFCSERQAEMIQLEQQLASGRALGSIPYAQVSQQAYPAYDMQTMQTMQTMQSVQPQYMQSTAAPSAMGQASAPVGYRQYATSQQIQAQPLQQPQGSVQYVQVNPGMQQMQMQQQQQQPGQGSYVEIGRAHV